MCTMVRFGVLVLLYVMEEPCLLLCDSLRRYSDRRPCRISINQSIIKFQYSRNPKKSKELLAYASCKFSSRAN